MLTIYPKIVLRNFFRNKIFSVINILGLSLGLVACIFIYQYSSLELSYDNFHKDADRIYRISFQKFLDGKRTDNIAKSPAALHDVLKTEIPEVEIVTAFYPIDKVTISSENAVKFNSDKVFAIDTSFTKIFTPIILRGSSTGDGVLISESIAEKHFNKVHPINNIVSISLGDDKYEKKIMGVFKDTPVNSHMTYDILIIDNDIHNDDTSWEFTGSYTYVKLKENTSVSEFTRKINELTQANTKKDFNVKVILTAQSLRDIHLYSDLNEELSPNGNYNSLLFLILIGCFILVIAWINYVNLSLAKSTERLKEIGIRKVIGSDTFSLIKQFLLESSLYNILSVTIAVCLAKLLTPYISELSGKQLFFDDLLIDLNFWLGLSTIIIIGTIVTGLYPALVYSKFKPVNALKGILSNSATSRTSFNKALMIFQFSITVFLIIGTLVIYKQMNFMRNSNLGIDINGIVVVKSPNIPKENWSDELVTYVIDSGYYNKVKTFSSLLSSYQSFNVASISHIPGKELIWGTEGFRREDAESNKVHALYMAGIDYEYFPVFKVQFLVGRNFSEEHRTDQLNAVILNEEACKQLGFEKPEHAIGKNLVFYDNSKKEIIGVVKNYHQESLKQTIKPTFYQLLPRALDYFAVSIPSGNLQQSISVIKEQWTKTFEDNPFEYFFLDDFFNEHYKQDQKFGELFTLFTSLSIFIACIGLFGISSHMLMQRTKEIGIRKILGATLIDILRLLSSYYVKLVLVSFIIAAPIGYFIMTNWLDDFAFKTDLDWRIFAIPLITILLITLITISFQSIKTSLTDPVKSLRSE
ncbi:MAG: ABC transporter permease [Cyclobacteriaceae bacterium]|nr:ABC transporter permease [Cyclobacteriaceae bacterium]